MKVDVAVFPSGLPCFLAALVQHAFCSEGLILSGCPEENLGKLSGVVPVVLGNSPHHGNMRRTGNTAVSPSSRSAFVVELILLLMLVL